MRYSVAGLGFGNVPGSPMGGTFKAPPFGWGFLLNLVCRWLRAQIVISGQFIIDRKEFYQSTDLRLLAGLFLLPSLHLLAIAMSVGQAVQLIQNQRF